MIEKIDKYNEIVGILRKIANELGYKVRFKDVDINLIDNVLEIKGNAENK